MYEGFNQKQKDCSMFQVVFVVLGNNPIWASNKTPFHELVLGSLGCGSVQALKQPAVGTALCPSPACVLLQQRRSAFLARNFDVKGLHSPISNSRFRRHFALILEAGPSYS